MAYTFDKIDDYFRKNKTGTTGSLQKGQTSAPAPTKAAQNLARAAETSPSGAGAYRQQQGEDTSAISGRLLAPATQQMQNWGAQQDVAYSVAKAAGEQKIADKYQPYDQKTLTGAVQGTEADINKLKQQSSFTGDEITQTPYQVTPLKMDTTSFLSGGVGGVQSGLQKKGGRYTPGMAALDASLFSANRGGVTGLQSAVGGMYEQGRQKQAQLEGLDEYLAKTAKTTGTNLASQVKEAVGSKAKELQKALRTRREGEISASKQSERAGYVKDLERQAEELIAANPAAVSEGFTYKTMPNFDVSRYITPTATTETIAPTQDLINLASILRVQPETFGDYNVATENYAVDPYGMQTDIDKAMTDYITRRRPVPKTLPPSTIPVGEIITEIPESGADGPIPTFGGDMNDQFNQQVNLPTTTEQLRAIDTQPSTTEPIYGTIPEVGAPYTEEESQIVADELKALVEDLASDGAFDGGSDSSSDSSSWGGSWGDYDSGGGYGW